MEKAPRDVFTTSFKQSGKPELAQKVNAVEATTSEKVGTEDIESLDTATIYVKNLNFSTKQEEFQKVFKPLEGYLSAVIRAKPDPKRPGKYLSMGFGFVEFKDKASAVAAMRAMNGFVLDGHKLEIKLSHQGVDAAAEVRKQDSSKPKGTKILIKNLPFEATKRMCKAYSVLMGNFVQFVFLKNSTAVHAVSPLLNLLQHEKLPMP